LVYVVVEDRAPDEFVSCDNDERLYPDLVGRSNIEPSDERFWLNLMRPMMRRRRRTMTWVCVDM
jgi:hypothetical protein